MAGKRIISAKIYDAQGLVFEGEVDRISSFNEVGAFDIYPMHANFISIIGKRLDLYKAGKVVKGFEVEKAILKVKKDQLIVFLGIDAEDTKKSGGDLASITASRGK